MRRWPTLAIVGLCLSGGSAFGADKAACLDAHAQAQVLRHHGKLRAAREQLLSCTRPACPTLVTNDCTAWLNEVGIELPSVVVVAHDAGGHDTAAVRVLVDHELVAERLEGKPIDVDPGEHVFRYERSDGVSVESRVLIQDGEKARVLRVDFGPPAPVASAVTSQPPVPVVAPDRPVERPPPAPSPHISPFTWVAGAVGVAALGSWAYFGLTGLSHQSRLSSSCSPECSENDVSTLKTQYRLADASLAIGVIAFGVATVIGIVSTSHRESGRPARSLDYGPLLGGGGGIVAGRF